MLQSIRLENFQAHAATEIALAQGITVIVGTSNTGKTAILRGLRWAANNRPSGSGFIRHGQETASVKVVTDDGQVVRSRGKKANFYNINGEQFDALAKTVPPDVTRVLGLAEVNVQNQLDPVFLLLDSPGAIASAVSSAVNLQDGEVVTDRLSSLIREDARTLAAMAAERDRLAGDLRRFASLDAYRLGVEALIASWTILDALAASHTGLLDAAGRLMDASDALEATPEPPAGIDEWLATAERLDREYVDLCIVADDLGVAVTSLRGANLGLDTLSDPGRLADAALRVEARIAGCSAVSRTCEGLYTIRASMVRTEEQLDALLGEGELVPMAESVRMAAASASKTEGDWLALKGFTAGIRELDRAVDGAARFEVEAEARYNEALAGLDACPACGQKLDESAKEHLLEHK